MPDQPSGTVTFLFTDIEGSTKSWENNPELMKGALSRHDAILRSSIESGGGYVVKSMPKADRGNTQAGASPGSRGDLSAARREGGMEGN